MMVNACVTGILPGFRYVLLTDALIESLSPLEIAAVFGHEIGHIAHRHLLYFAFFFMGSLGVLTVLAEIVSTGWSVGRAVGLADSVDAGGRQRRGPGRRAAWACWDLYFWIVFGQLSRRFERQADVFGSKVVSCDLARLPSA